MDGRTLQSSCESGLPAGYDGYKRKRGSKVHMAVDTLGHLLAVHVTPADEQERAQVQRLCEDATFDLVLVLHGELSERGRRPVHGDRAAAAVHAVVTRTPDDEPIAVDLLDAIVLRQPWQHLLCWPIQPFRVGEQCRKFFVLEHDELHQ